MAIIVFEGPDGGGKSTAVDAIAKDFKIKAIHPGKPPATFAQYRQFLINQLNASERKEWHIYDRLSVISEFVYKPLRQEINVSTKHEDSEYVRFTLAHLGALICRRLVVVYCRPDDDDVIFNNSAEFTEHDTPETMDTVINKTNQIIDRYDALMMFIKSFGVHVIEYDYRIMDIEELASKIRRGMYDQPE